MFSSKLEVYKVQLVIVVVAAAIGGSWACNDDFSMQPSEGTDAGEFGVADAGQAGDGEVLRKARVTGTGGVGLNLRDMPSTAATVIDLMPEGTIVDLLSGPDEDWYQVRHQDQEGYAAAGFLMEIDPDASVPEGTGGLLNLLPWEPETSHRVSRAHGNTGGHTGDSYWAWDFAMPVGTPVLAAHDGVVRVRRSSGNTGCCSASCGPDANYVVLDRGDGTESLYLHLSKALVAKGDVLRRGDLVGESGETGYACGAHLHFQMQKSPAGGGTSYQYNKSVSEVFHDTGTALDPGPGDTVISKNGVLDLP